MTEDFDARLRRLEDIEAIRALAARYVFAIDTRDLAGLESCFARNACFRSKDGVMSAVGRDAVMAQFRARFSALGPGAHYTHDHVVWLDGDAVARGLLSSHAELVRHGRPMLASIRYEDRYIREDGEWRFSDRLLGFFYYLPTEEYLHALARRDRMRAYEARQPADFPESTEPWRAYYGEGKPE